MARYIDAELLKTDLLKGAYSSISKLIDRQPTADVQEVVHGHWYCVEISENKWWNTCSVCKDTWQDDEGKITFAYCPTCGAKMDEGEVLT